MNSLAKKSLKLGKAVYTAVNDAVAHPDQYVGHQQQQYNPQQLQYPPQQSYETPNPSQFLQGQPHAQSGAVYTGYIPPQGNNPYQQSQPVQTSGSYDQPLYSPNPQILSTASPSGQYQTPTPQALNPQYPPNGPQSTGIIGQSPAPAQNAWAPYPSFPISSISQNQINPNPQPYNGPASPLTASSTPAPCQQLARPQSGPTPINSFTPPAPGYPSPISHIQTSAQSSPASGAFPFANGRTQPASPALNQTNLYPTLVSPPGQPSQYPNPQNSQVAERQEVVGFIAELAADVSIVSDGVVELPAEVPANGPIGQASQKGHTSEATRLTFQQQSWQPQDAPPQPLLTPSHSPNPSMSPMSANVYNYPSPKPDPNGRVSSGSISSGAERTPSGPVSAGVGRTSSPIMIPPSAVTRTATNQLQEPKPMHPPGSTESVASHIPAITPNSPSPSMSPIIGYNPGVYPKMPNANVVMNPGNPYLQGQSPFQQHGQQFASVPYSMSLPQQQYHPNQPQYGQQQQQPYNQHSYPQQRQSDNMTSLAQELQQTNMYSQPPSQSQFQYHASQPTDQKFPQTPSLQPQHPSFVQSLGQAKQVLVNENAPGYHPNGPPPPYIP